jgi:hypothetical protein
MSGMTRTLHESQIKMYQFYEKEFIEQNLHMARKYRAHYLYRNTFSACVTCTTNIYHHLR